LLRAVLRLSSSIAKIAPPQLMPAHIMAQ
jgi:hypothetical protein